MRGDGLSPAAKIPKKKKKIGALLRIFAVFFFIPSLLLWTEPSSADLYLLRSIGSVQFLSKDNKALTVRPGSAVPAEVRIQTGSSGRALFELRSPRRGQISLQSESEIHWAEQELLLQSGVVYFDRSMSNEELQLRHPVGHWTLGPQSRAILSLVGEKEPRLSLLELQGSVDFYVLGRGSDRPERGPLEALRFLAHKDEQGWVIDIYKSGARAARGDWAKELPLAESRVSEVQSRFRVSLPSPPRRPASSRAPASLASSRPDQLCQSPSAQLNECVWRMAQGRCQRARCMANGEWGDAQALPTSLQHVCTSSPRTGPCDY